VLKTQDTMLEEHQSGSQALQSALASEGVELSLSSDIPTDTGAFRPFATFECAGRRYVVCREDPPEPAHPKLRFSGRELEIARLISRGHTTRTVAAVLEISPWTVSTYVRRMFAKVDVASRSALIARMAALGLLEGGGG
jgi:DNA-binding CsgD family transcriptional regulator